MVFGINLDCNYFVGSKSRTAYLNACAATGIHQSDDIRKVHVKEAQLIPTVPTTNLPHTD
eukprot:5894995-Amphidinium_carterae.1